MNSQKLLKSGKKELRDKNYFLNFSSNLVKQKWSLYLVIGFIFLLLSLFILFPLSKVFIQSIYLDQQFTLSAYQSIFSSIFSSSALINSLSLGISVAICGTFIGYLFAYLTIKTPFKYKFLPKVFGTFPIISPPFVLSLAAILLLGQNGWITKNILIDIFGMDGFSIYGFKGLLIVETMCYFPTAYLIFYGTFSAIDPSIEDASANLGANFWYRFKHIFFPLTKPAIFSSLLLIFIESISDFGNPLVLSGNFKVLSVQAYLKITGEFDLNSGAALSMVLLIPSLIAFWVQKYYVDNYSYVTLSGKTTSGSLQKDFPPKLYFLLKLFCFIISSIILVFYSTVIIGSFVTVWGINNTLTLSNYIAGFSDSWDYFIDTFILAFIATPLTGILALIIAYLVVRKKFWGKSFMELTSMLTFAVPGTVVGIGYVLAFNEKPILLTGTSLIIILLFIFRNMPVGLRSSIASLKQLDPNIEEAGRNLGAGPIRVLKDITFPLLAPAFFSGLAYSFVRCMTAVSAIIFVVSGSWNLLTVSLLGQVENGHLSTACAICVLLILFAGSILFFMQNYFTSKGARS